MSNPVLRRLTKVRHGQASESRVINRLGARRTVASGALPTQKGDGRSKTEFIEAKATVKGSYSIKLALLHQITQQAVTINRYPVLTLSFTDGAGQAREFGDWVVLPMWAYEELRHRAKRN